MNALMQAVEENGFVVVPRCVDESTVEILRDQLANTNHAERNLLSIPAVRKVASSHAIREIIGAVIGVGCFAVRGILFNKNQRSNWKVTWHQDLTIAVRERRAVDGFGPWTTKAGVLHVQPSVEVMSRILAIRLHLDESGLENGPLKVIPASHKRGRLSAGQITDWDKTNCVTCTVPKGGALLMRPLLLHSSSACVIPNSRRVIHLEFATEELPHGLEWHDRV
jgi:ectoine hydroxylase-related dioxygenase (phytanoyl-CoA dioxygenase family)